MSSEKEMNSTTRGADLEAERERDFQMPDNPIRAYVA